MFTLPTRFVSGKSPRSSTTRRPAATRPCVRLQVESLEGRELPSTTPLPALAPAAAVSPAAAQGTAWKQLPGNATDLAIGANGAVWAISSNPNTGEIGKYVMHWTGNNWQQFNGLGAQHIAVDHQGNPWIVTSTSDVWRLVGGTWYKVGTGAVDIGIGGNGTVAVVGGNADGVGHHQVAIWNGSSFSPLPGLFQGGQTLSVAVDPYGKPWVVDHGTIFRWTGGQWQQLPGNAVDLDIGANGAVWMVGDGFSDSGTGFNIYQWTGSSWQLLKSSNVGGAAIAVDPSGNPWVTDWGNNIFAHVGTSSSSTGNPPSGSGTTPKSTTTPTPTPTMSAPPSPFDLLAQDVAELIHGMESGNIGLAFAGLGGIESVLNSNPDLQTQLMLTLVADAFADI
jgi:hypothetical protein